MHTFKISILVLHRKKKNEQHTGLNANQQYFHSVQVNYCFKQEKLESYWFYCKENTPSEQAIDLTERNMHLFYADHYLFPSQPHPWMRDPFVRCHGDGIHHHHHNAGAPLSQEFMSLSGRQANANQELFIIHTLLQVAFITRFKWKWPSPSNVL